ncbi:MAG: bifunctional aspartate kinase/homoserine dehydrogenase I [Parachlamydia sp.]|nr:bifunctional aspartate kinase/homoserine dehydrogenase I [Parachlamydia sp.]
MSVEKVLKFGGSSVGTPDRIQNVIQIIKGSYDGQHPLIVVVSAFGGMTDQLIAAAKTAAGHSVYKMLWNALKERHVTAAEKLIPQYNLPKALKVIEEEFQSLSNILEGLYLVKELTAKTLDEVMSFGERLSAFIISEALKVHVPETAYGDARKWIKTDRNFGEARVDYAETNQRIRKQFHHSSTISIVTGFIGSSHQDETTTLGRGGSDFSASIIGAALGVNLIEIWTDVDGVMTADPRKEENAFPISEMSYREAMEMSHFGAKVIHPPTMTPAMKKNIPILIKNSFNPQAKGTFISNKPSQSVVQVCGISSIDQVALLGLQGSGMVGVCGIAKRLFGALAEKGISVILISQGSSEHSICFAIAPQFVQKAVEAIQKEFALEMKAQLIDEVTLERELSVIAAVGETMHQTPGISGKLFGALGKNGINVIAIAQGSSELNVSIVVRKEDEVKAIKTIHEAFFLSSKTTLNVFVAGTGLIGSTLLKLVQCHARALAEDHALQIRIVGLADSRHLLMEAKGLQLDDWKMLLHQSIDKMHINLFVERMLNLNLPNTIFVDCTSSQAMTDAYGKILNASIAIVTPNKKANSGPYEQYQQLKTIASKRRVRFFYGANVGAGLPIISTIRELLRSGDIIVKIEAILSGTLSYLFNTFTGEKPFSQVVREAKEKGYTEPDPRDDLSGMDFARKLLILSRESGYSLEMDEISLQRFLPDDCFDDSSLEDFYAKLQREDGRIDAFVREATTEDKRLRYMATFENGKGTVSLHAVDASHPFYHLSGSDNIIAITTEFYREQPLVIKGPGAGAEVTAAKVLADIVRIGTEQ